MMTHKPSKLGQTVPLFGLHQSLLVGLCSVHAGLQVYLHSAVVMTCAMLVNTQIHRRTAFDQLYY